MTLRSLLVVTALAAGCGGKHPGSYENKGAGGAPVDELGQLVAQADALWEQRVDEAKLQEALAAYAKVVEKDPKHRHALGRLTRGWYFWGDAFTSDKTTQLDRWGKALEHGSACLAVNAKFAEVIAAGAKEKDAAAHAVADDVPCLYWTATSLGKWGKAQGIAKTLKHLPTVKAYIAKVEELDATYFHYGPARYWGAYYAALPSFAGQDLVKSGEYFDAAIAGAEYYLPTRVLRAEMLSVATQDLKQFDADLMRVLSSDPNTRAEVVPENTKDQEKARALLARRAELFDAKLLAEAGPAPVPPAPSSAVRAPEPAPAVVPAPEGEPSTATRPEGEVPGPDSAATRPEAPAPDSEATRPEPTPAPAPK